MKKFFFFIILIFLTSCSKPKTVLICGDHICINDKEAQSYFEKNLTLEVQIIDNKKNDQVDLVELNLSSNRDDMSRRVSIKKRNVTKKKLKTLSNKEIKQIKASIKKEEKVARLKKPNKDKDLNKEKKSSIHLENFPEVPLKLFCEAIAKPAT